MDEHIATAQTTPPTRATRRTWFLLAAHTAIVLLVFWAFTPLILENLLTATNDLDKPTILHGLQRIATPETFPLLFILAVGFFLMLSMLQALRSPP